MTGMQIDQALGDRMVQEAVARCAGAHFAGDLRRARLALLRGHCEHCACVSEGLVDQIAGYLGQVGGAVRGVYEVRAEGTERTDDPDRRGGQSAIHLVVWVERKSPALKALATTLETVLASSRQKLGCPTVAAGCFALDVEMVDDRDMREERGLGLVVRNPQVTRREVWAPQAGAADLLQAPEGRQTDYSLPEPFDPEFIPEGRLIDHALTIERMPPEERGPLEHHLTELKVTLIRRVISDQLGYIEIARRWFDVADLAEIYRHRLGFGKIGGKAAGMLLAERILRQEAGPELRRSLTVPESFFLGSDLMYIYMAMNGLTHWNDQKYKPEDEIREDYPQILNDFERGEFPPEIRGELRAMLDRIGTQPLIVRSSSQLEDSLGTSFAGKYDSHFCPNQGTPEDNLSALVLAIARTYASTFNPDALLYRRSRGLQDYDERMAVLIQGVQGERWGRFYLPFAAGVGFSRNLYRWDPQIRAEDGFSRLVWGLGTRAVERVGNDYPRLVALSHPRLQPDDAPQAIRHYSQQLVDVIDLETNRIATLPIADVLGPGYPPLRHLVQIEEEGYFSPLRSRLATADVPRLAITFDEFLGRTRFAGMMRELLRTLEIHWGTPIDVEFTARLRDPGSPSTEIDISLLQCRPLPAFQTGRPPRRLEDIDPADIVLASRFIVPDGYLPKIRHVVFVDPARYFALPTETARRRVARVIGKVNSSLQPNTFICVGPGRWGTENPDLGVLVGYADICHAGALVELSGHDVGPAPEPSLGTHFFHDLMEAQIYPIAVNLDRAETIYRRDFFLETESCLAEHVDGKVGPDEPVRLIDVTAYRPGHHLELVLDAGEGKTTAYLAKD